MKRICLIGLLILLAFAQLQAQNNIEDLKEKYRKSIAEAMKKYKVVGTSIALVHGDRTIWAEGFGFADKKTQKKTSTDTKFMLGSVTKVFTTTALMKLQEQGKLNINQPLKKYLPNFNIRSRFGSIRQVTLKNILTHHSGLPSDFLRGLMGTQVEDFTKIIDYVNQSTMALPPNLIKAYSNVGFSLLGCAIQDVSKEKYPSYLKKNIFSPLQMNHSGFYQGGRFPLGFTQYYDHEGKLAQEIAIRDVPAGAMYSSVNDLTKFLKALYPNSNTQQILKPSTLNEIFMPQNVSYPLDFGNKQALCWFMSEDPKFGKIFRHGGDTKYTHTIIAVIPSLKIGVAFLSNSEKGNKIRKVALQLMKEYATLKGLARQQSISKTPRDFTKYTIVKKSADQLQQYTGSYANPSIGIFKVKLKNDTLQANLGGTFGQFIPTKSGEFLVKVPGPGIIPQIRISFEQVAGYQLMTQTQAGESKEILGNKVDLKSLNKLWKMRVGKYKVINALPGGFEVFSNFNVVLNDNHLVITLKQNLSGGKITMAIQPENNNEGYTLGLGRQAGNYVRFAKNNQGQEVLHFYGYQLLKQ
ncbi:hypothetical protein BKI52_09720 [marine bacterium AO1-C]|nr:hypothetical protein BKI52_09720 [marine bacterium AO1-C]